MANIFFFFSVLLVQQFGSEAFAFSSTSNSQNIATDAPKELSKKNDSARTQFLDVAIVGAGPAGLVLAHSLRDRGYSVQVLERRSSFRPVGSAVFLHPFAINSLQSLSPLVAENVLEAATQIGTVTVKSTTKQNNNVIFDKFDNAPNVFGAPFVTIRFWDMLQALKEGLPDDIFTFGKDVQGYEELKNGQIKLFYSSIDGDDDNDMDVPTTGSIEAGMVIDAGGIRSNIRKQIVPHMQSVPFCKAYMSVVPAEKANRIMKKSDTMTERELSFLVGDLDGMTLATLGNGDVWWTYTYFDDSIDSALTKEQMIERFQDRFPAFITELVDATEDRIETVIADLPVSWKWGEGNVTLLGDAAHAQLPALGLGCSAAFADIEELCRQIDSNGLSPTALRWYERLRMPQTAILQKASRLAFAGAKSIGQQK